MSPPRPPVEPLVSAGHVALFASDMTVTVAADVSLGALQHRLADAGQWLPIDGDETAPVGSLVEQNSTGPVRLGYGAWRDLLLGCQFRNGRGELVSAGGRAVKNVAGYDLTKLMVGQRGTLGRVVTITTRTYRRPAGAVLARFPGGDAARLGQLLPTALRPQWAVLTPDDLLCGYLGDERTLAYYRERLPAVGNASPSVVARSLAEDTAHRAALFTWPAPAFRAAVPPARAAEFVERAQVRRWAADAAFGIVVGQTTDREPLAIAAAAVGGSIVDGSAAVPPALAPLLARLRAAFAPIGGTP